MKKVMPCVLFIVIGLISFYFAFQENTTATLGIPLTIVGAVSVVIGLYKSWRCGIMTSILDLFELSAK